ncbi:MAG: poly(A) polymerase [Flammeovirgaceae bacterium]
MKPRFNTSREIYNRILWDEQFNERAFFMGYQDRMSRNGMREKPLIEWGTSEIPWSRVYYIRCADEWVWDREKRIDLFETGQLPAEAFNQVSNALVAHESVFERSIYHKVGMSWENYIQELTTTSVDQLRILTLNVLTDRYERGKLHSEERWAWLAHQLQKTTADIILLQEVTSRFYEILLRKRWFYSWYSSESPACSNLKPHGNIILSRYPFRLKEWRYSSAKRFLIASLLLNGTTFQVANVHLSSNQNANAPAVRKQQFVELVAILESQPSAFLIGGDFNMREAEQPTEYVDTALLDCWKSVNPNAEGLTYHPEVNSLARLFSLTGKPGRLDRMLLHPSDEQWRVSNSSLIFNQAIGNFSGKLFPSDHFGLLTQLSFSKQAASRLPAAFQQKPNYQSAIVWIPPKALWPAIQQLRKKFDSKYARWMPHVTLVYGFISEVHFAEVVDQLAERLKSIEPFTIQLGGYGYFEHRKSTTAWLRPLGNDTAWQQLQHVLEEPFEHCKEQSTRNSGFTPHLSIGQFATPDEAKKQLPTWKMQQTTVGEIALISRGKDTPFEWRYKIALGSGKLTVGHVSDDEQLRTLLNREMPTVSLKRKQQMTLIQTLVEDACGEVIGQKVQAFQLGSTALGTATQTGDLDVVCSVPQEVELEDILTQMAQVLTGLVREVHLVFDAQMPALRFQAEGIAVDVLLARNPYFPKPLTEIMERNYREFDQVSWMALGGVLEVQNLNRLISEKVDFELFIQLVKLVKYWAKQRKVFGNAWGFLGSYSWTILVAWSVVNHHEKPTLTGALRNFFQLLCNHDWSKPIALVEREKAYKVSLVRDRMPILTTVHPQFNSARNITQSTAAILKHEFASAAHFFKEKQLNWNTFFAPAAQPTGISISCFGDAKAMQALSGWIEGHVITLVITLEKLGLTLRPWPELIQLDGGIQFVIGVSDELPEEMHPSLQKVITDFMDDFGWQIQVRIDYEGDS